MRQDYYELTGEVVKLQEQLKEWDEADLARIQQGLNNYDQAA